MEKLKYNENKKNSVQNLAIGRDGKSFLKYMNKENLLTGLLALLVLVTILLPIRDLDAITDFGNEIQYWGGAMTILGQDWSHYMDRSVIISYAYSLILLPICVIIKNPSFAYKVAIILNGFIWMSAYIYSVQTSKKILRNDNQYISVVGCFLIFLLPIYTASKALLGPEALLVLLFWVCTNLISQLSVNSSKKILNALGLVIVFMVWLDPTMIVVFLGSIAYMIHLLQNEKLKEDQLLKWILFVFIGIIIGNVAEQLLLYVIFNGTGVVYNAGIQGMWERMVSNLSKYGFVNFFFSVIGKVYSCMVNTMAFFSFFFFVIKRAVEKREGELEFFLATVLLLLFLVNSLCWVTDTANIGNRYFNYGTIPIVLGPVLLMAIQKMLDLINWEKYSMIGVLFLFGLTIIVGDLFKTGGDLGNEINMGIINYVQNSTEAVVGTIYFCTVIAFVIILMMVALLRIKPQWGKKIKLSYIMIGSVIAAEIVLNNKMIDANVVKEQKECVPYYDVAEVINNMDASCYYFPDTSGFDAKISTLQMLSNLKGIRYVEDKDAAQAKLLRKYAGKETPVLIITTGSYEKWEKKLADYQVIYTSVDYVLWSNNSLKLQQLVDEVIVEKERKAERIKDEDEIVFGEDIILSPGTYIAHFKLKVKKYNKKYGIGKLIIRDNSGELQTIVLDKEQIEPGKMIIDVPFTSSQTMQNVRFSISCEKRSKIKGYKVTYQKENSDFTIGIDHKQDFDEICQTIQNMDGKIGARGTVGIVGNQYAGKQSNMDYACSLFSGYQIKKICASKNGRNQADYFIFDTAVKEYFDFLEDCSIAAMNNGYTLLVKNKSVQSRTAEKMQGFLYSDGYKIDIRAFMQPTNAGEYNLMQPITLQGGVYNYICELILEKNNQKSKELGVLCVMNGTKELGRVKLTSNKLRLNESSIYNIPLMYSSTAKRLRLQLKLNKGVSIKAVPRYIELKQQKYMLGQEEKGIIKFANIIKGSDSKAKVSFLVGLNEKQKDTISLAYLHRLMPEIALEKELYDEIMDENGDLFILTYGYSTSFWKMLSKYTIISISGKYSLWTKTNGRYFAKALESGGIAYSQGKKISLYSIAKMQGQAYDGTVSNLLSGPYRIYLDVQLENPKPDDTVEIGLSRNKTQEEIMEETDALKELGYNKKEMDSRIEREFYTSTKEYSVLDSFDGSNSLVTSLDIYCPKRMKNLRPVIYSWKGSKLKAEITWIELLE